MVNWLNTWAEKIIVVLIVCTIIEMILPEGKNKKYIKTVMGIYVAFTIISPIISKINNGINIDLEKYLNQMNNYNETIEVASKIDTNKYIGETYKEKLKTEIKTILSEENYEVKNIKIEIETKNEKEFGKVLNLELEVSKVQETKSNIKINKIKISEDEDYSENEAISEKEKEDIKKVLFENYNIEKNKIMIK